MNHDSLAQIPVNSVLIGLFTEALNMISTPGNKFPEYITINGSPAANTTSRTYKFKSVDVRKYLEGLSDVIGTALTNFMPKDVEFATDTIPMENKSETESENETGSENEIESVNSSINKSSGEDETISDKDDAVAILDEEPSSSETGETQEAPELINQTLDEKNAGNLNNLLKGGARMPKPRTRTVRNKKLSLKTLKKWN